MNLKVLFSPVLETFRDFHFLRYASDLNNLLGSRFHLSFHQTLDLFLVSRTSYITVSHPAITMDITILCLFQTEHQGHVLNRCNSACAKDSNDCCLQPLKLVCGNVVRLD